MSSQSALDPAVEFIESDRAAGAERGEARSSRPFLTKIVRALRRQAPVLAICLVVGAAAAATHLYFLGFLSWPLLGAWLAAALVTALVFATAREIWREAIDFNVLRRLSTPVLGAAPELTPRALRQLPPDVRSPLGALAFQPASDFAGAFRDLQDELPNRTVVSFIAPLPDEGTTTTALCAALAAAQQDRRVVVIDCDLRRRALTKALGFEPSEGVLEACERPEDWRTFIQEEPETGLHCIPAARTRTAWRSLIDITGLPLLIEQLRAEYDLIVLDCPPALATAEGPVIARLADRSIVVAVWDETPLSAVRGAMRTLKARARGKAVGIYVNRAPPRYRANRLRPH